MKVTIKKKTSVRKSPSKMNLTEPILKNFPVLHSPIKEGKIFSPTIDKTQPKEHVPKPPHTPKKVKTPKKEKTPEKVQKVKTPEKPRKKEKPEKPRKEKTPQKEKTPKKKEKTPKKKEKTPTPQKEKTPTPKKEYNEGMLNQLTGKELKQILSEQGKPQYGTKAVMVQRILGNKVKIQPNKYDGQPLPSDLKKMTVIQLKVELKKQNLPINGNKAELIARLEKINKGEKITPKKPGRKHAEKTPKKRGRKPKAANNTSKKDLDRKDYEKMTVLQLKALLKEKGGKISGNKTQLIDRLLTL